MKTKFYSKEKINIEGFYFKTKLTLLSFDEVVSLTEKIVRRCIIIYRDKFVFDFSGDIKTYNKLSGISNELSRLNQKNDWSFEFSFDGLLKDDNLKTDRLASKIFLDASIAEDNEENESFYKEHKFKSKNDVMDYVENILNKESNEVITVSSYPDMGGIIEINKYSMSSDYVYYEMSIDFSILGYIVDYMYDELVLEYFELLYLLIEKSEVKYVHIGTSPGGNFAEYGEEMNLGEQIEWSPDLDNFYLGNISWITYIGKDMADKIDSGLDVKNFKTEKNSKGGILFRSDKSICEFSREDKLSLREHINEIMLPAYDIASPLDIRRWYGYPIYKKEVEVIKVKYGILNFIKYLPYSIREKYAIDIKVNQPVVTEDFEGEKLKH